MTSPEDFDVVIHSEVDISAAAAIIWPSILDPKNWKQGLQLVHESGPHQEVGERQVGHGPDGSVLLIVDTVALDPERRMVVKLTSPSGEGSGWAAWILRERDGETNVSYDVYVSARTDGELSVAENLERYQQRFDAELLALRELIGTR